ncbi:MAG: DUF2130 domain-containing protein [Bacteroidota bacterium]
MKTTVKCPNCQSSIPLDELVLKDFKNSIKKEFEDELRLREEGLSHDLEKARNEIRKQVQQESNLTIKTKEKLISDLKEQLLKIRQKLENSSQQMIGEVQELELESILATSFPADLIEPVPKGKNGADCTQHVRMNGITIGTILFESKRVANFSEGWIDKLKKDNLQAKCDATVIITSKMPSDISGNFGIKDGVWICLFEPEAIKQLVLVLRYIFVKAFEILQTKHSDDTKEKLFQFLTSTEFLNQVEHVLKCFKVLEQTFQDERKKLTTLWKIREQHLQEMLTSTLEMYGSMRGISTSIPEISMLELRQAI